MYSWVASWFTEEEKKQALYAASNASENNRPMKLDEWTWVEVIQETNDQPTFVQTDHFTTNQIPYGSNHTEKRKRKNAVCSLNTFTTSLHNDYPLLEKPRLFRKFCKINMARSCEKTHSVSRILSPPFPSSTIKCLRLEVKHDWMVLFKREEYTWKILGLIMTASMKKKVSATPFTYKPQLSIEWEDRNNIARQNPMLALLGCVSSKAVCSQRKPLLTYHDAPLSNENLEALLMIDYRDSLSEWEDTSKEFMQIHPVAANDWQISAQQKPPTRRERKNLFWQNSLKSQLSFCFDETRSKKNEPKKIKWRSFSVNDEVEKFPNQFVFGSEDASLQRTVWFKTVIPAVQMPDIHRYTKTTSLEGAQSIYNKWLNDAILVNICSANVSRRNLLTQRKEQQEKAIVIKKKIHKHIDKNKKQTTSLMKKNKAWLKRRNNIKRISAKTQKQKRGSEQFSGQGGNRAC